MGAGLSGSLELVAEEFVSNGALFTLSKSSRSSFLATNWATPIGANQSGPRERERDWENNNQQQWQRCWIASNAFSSFQPPLSLDKRPSFEATTIAPARCPVEWIAVQCSAVQRSGDKCQPSARPPHPPLRSSGGR